MIHPGSLGHALHHLLRGRNAAKPAVDPADSPDRSFYVSGRTAVGVKNLGCVDSLHGFLENIGFASARLQSCHNAETRKGLAPEGAAWSRSNLCQFLFQ